MAPPGTVPGTALPRRRLRRCEIEKGRSERIAFFQGKEPLPGLSLGLSGGQTGDLLIGRGGGRLLFRKESENDQKERQQGDGSRREKEAE